jgi:hypothetical protein
VVDQLLQMDVLQAVGVLAGDVELLYVLVVTATEEGPPVLPLGKVNGPLVVAFQQLGNVFAETEETIAVTLAKQVDVGESVPVTLAILGCIHTLIIPAFRQKSSQAVRLA